MISHIRPFTCLLRSKAGNASSQIWRSVLLRHRSGLVSNQVNYLNMISLCIFVTIGRKNRCLWLIGLMVYADPQFTSTRPGSVPVRITFRSFRQHRLCWHSTKFWTIFLPLCLPPASWKQSPDVMRVFYRHEAEAEAPSTMYTIVLELHGLN